MKKHFTAHIIFAATAMASQQVWALGFGRAVSDAVLGQSFTFAVPVTVDPGERFGLDCMSAEVYYGESRLLPNAVRTDVERGTVDNTWIVRITAAAPVTEPIIEVALSAGCERRFTRRFSIFADPPTLGTTAAQLPQVAPIAAPATTATTTATAGEPATALPAANGGRAAAARAARHAAGAASSAHPHVVRKGPTMALANELNAPPAAAPSARHVGDAGSARKPGPRVAGPSSEEAARLVLDPGVPHLKLDMEEPVIPPPSSASGAAIGLSDLDDPDTRQLRALEQSIQAIKHDGEVQREQTAKLQSELAQSQSRSDWLPWLAGMLALALAAIGALLWRLRQQNRIAHSDWFNQSQLGPLPPAAPPSEQPVEAAPVVAPIPDLRDRVPAPAASHEVLADFPAIDDGDARGVPVVTDQSATRPLDRQAMAAAMAAEAAPRELSVEELLDLEQQADFFIALGQEDAAVDLLMSHLRSAGGQSPLPYTKLLEIYRRQGDRSAYERTRARFNRRFNAYAPDWDTGPTAGRSLEDYPETIALLEGAWPSPIDAMAILEGLLFKRDDSSELFDLPAYRDVLVLYSLARDLWQHGGGSTGTQVDVLLPLGDSDPTAPMPIYPSARDVNERALPTDDLGLDLESVDVEGDTRTGMLTSFEMTGFEPAHGGGRVDLELPQSGDDVHATLDEMSLSPVAPTRTKPSPHDWHEGDPPDSELPTKR
jgi:pilus assembly protein FimV